MLTAFVPSRCLNVSEYFCGLDVSPRVYLDRTTEFFRFLHHFQFIPGNLRQIIWNSSPQALSSGPESSDLVNGCSFCGAVNMSKDPGCNRRKNLPDHIIEFFWHGPDIPCSLSVMCNGSRVFIEFWAKDLREPQNHPVATRTEIDFLRLLNAIEAESNDHDSSDNGREGEANIDGYDSHICPDDVLYHWILEPFRPVFRQLISASPPPMLVTLHDALNPPLLSYTLRTFQGRLKSLPHPTVPESLCTLILPTNLISNLPPAAQPPRLPLIKPQALRIAPSSGSQALNPNIVVHNTKPTYFKRIPRGAEDSIITEISALLRIQTLDPDHKLPIPRLLALVQDPDSYGNNHIIGILLTLINAAGDLGALTANAPGSLKKRWYRTIVQTVQTLHSNHIIWGDVKADNVLIDRQQNAWLVDFGGGVTAGWVDPELGGTKEGDLQGLRRLGEFLGLDSGTGSNRSSSIGISASEARSQSGMRRGNRSGSATRTPSQSGKSDSGNGSGGTRGGSRARSRSVTRSRDRAGMANESRVAKGM